MFRKVLETQVSQVLIKLFLITLFIIFNVKEVHAEELAINANESQEFTIDKSKITRAKIIEISKQCLERSAYKNDYIVSRANIHYDKLSHMWAVQFRKKNKEDDMCMYGVLIEKDTGHVMCQCLSGL